MKAAQLDLTEPTIKKSGRKWKVICPACGDVGANTTEAYAREAAQLHTAAVHPVGVLQPEVIPGLATADEDTLARLGDEVREWEKKARGALTSAVESQFAIGRRLAEARRILPDNQGYGRWFKKQGFGFNQQWGSVLRRAAEHEIEVRELMAGQKEPSIDAAVKAITREVRAGQRQDASTSQLVNDHRLVLPATVRIENRSALDHFPDEFADLAIFSPPYPDAGVVYDEQSDAINLADWCQLVAGAAAVLHDGWQVSRLCMVIPSAVGRSPYVPITGSAWNALGDAGFTPEAEIVWDKATTGNRTTWGSNRQPTEPRIRDRHEVVLVARSQHEQRIDKDEVLVDDGTGRKVSPWLDQDTFLEATQSVWQIGPESAKRVGHPAPFPPALVERLLRLYGWPGCTVLDPFAGSGTVGQVAIDLGANAVLCDQSEAYCELMRERLGLRAAS